ncbi:MAG: HAD-IC family P-type ATPase, partial [Pseudanabaenaceae cyanobacterium]
ANATFRNQTSEAIAQVYPGRVRSVRVEIPFQSARKWGAIALAEGDAPTTLVLGAPEELGAALLPPELEERWQESTAQGMRVLLLAGASTLPQRQPPRLPPDLTPLALVICQDELRPNVAQTLAEFVAAGLEIKLISGDSGETVAALARQVGLAADRVATGPELAALSPAEFQERVARTAIFGRISPEGKAQIVRSLRDQGRYVAMVGDGLNDVLAIKQANLGIALESGSKVTRNAADMVLLGDAFPTLPQTLLGGQRIHNGIHDVMKLFLVRVAYFTLLILAAGTINGLEAFPFHNKQSALITLLSVGLPTFTFPIFARPGTQTDSTFRILLRFVMPATLMLMLVALGVFLGHLLPLEVRAGRALVDATQLAIARSALVTITIFCGLLLVLFLKPPSRFWVAVEPLSHDRRYTGVALALLAVYGLVLAVPAARDFFDLVLLPGPEYLLLGAIAGLWSLLLRYFWRHRVLERFLGIKF